MQKYKQDVKNVKQPQETEKDKRQEEGDDTKTTMNTSRRKDLRSNQ